MLVTSWQEALALHCHLYIVLCSEYNKLIYITKAYQSRFFLNILVISSAIRNCYSLQSLNLTGCCLTWRGAELLAKLIKV